MERTYFDDRRNDVNGFVSRHFTWPGTVRLHGAALGWDILRAPVNVLLSPVLVLTRVAACLSRRVGWRSCADWLATRRILLRTAVARRVEELVVSDLLGLPLDRKVATRRPDALAREVLAAPQFREMIRKRVDTVEAEALGHKIVEALGEYASTRSAVAEMTTTLCALIVGILVFHSVTPGMISMAPGVANAVAQTAAIAEFPLGRTFGRVWYGVFHPSASPALVAGTLVGLVMIGSVVAAFAGILADPLQSWLGIHRRRLLRLIDTLEVEFVGARDRPFVAREHYYARLLDAGDALATVIRMFRN